MGSRIFATDQSIGSVIGLNNNIHVSEGSLDMEPKLFDQLRNSDFNQVWFFENGTLFPPRSSSSSDYTDGLTHINYDSILSGFYNASSFSYSVDVTDTYIIEDFRVMKDKTLHSIYGPARVRKMYKIMGAKGWRDGGRHFTIDHTHIDAYYVLEGRQLENDDVNMLGKYTRLPITKDNPVSEAALAQFMLEYL